MKSIIDNAVYIEKVSEQESGDTAWERATDTTVDYIPRKISVLDTTTKDTLETSTEIVKDDSLMLVDKDNNINEIVVDEVTVVSDSTNTHDIFNDGSCVATYQLNGDATDLGGNYDGTAGDNITYDSGKFGDAAVFNGDNITIETITLSNFSVSAWVCFSDDDKYCWLISNGDGSNALQACRIDSDGSSRIDVNTDGDDGDIATRDLSDGAFHHVVFIKDGSNGSVYVDNSKYSYDDNSLSTKDMSMKQFCRGDFKGQIDQVRIFNRALTADEVNALYNESKYSTAIKQSAVPTKAFFNDNLKVSIALEETVNRTFCKDVVLSKSSSTTTEFIGVNAISGLLKTGDKVLLDDTEVTPTEIKEESDGDNFKYTLTYDELSQAPETCVVPDRSTEVSVKSKTFDDTKFTYTYNSYNKQGKAIQRKLVAEKVGVEVISPFQSQMWKDK